VLGAGGLAGSAICKALRAADWDVTAAGRGEAPAGEADWLQGDANDGAWLAGALERKDALLYFISTTVPATSRGDPLQELQTSLPTIRCALEVASQHRACRFVFPSSGGAIYGQRETAATEADPVEPTSAYALGKLMAEDMVRFYGRTRKLNYDILRVTNLYGSEQPRHTPQGVIDVLLDNVLAGRPSAIWSPLASERDYIFVDDLAAAVVALLELTPPARRLLNVSSGRTHTLADVLSKVDATTGKPQAYRHDDQGYQGVSRSAVDNTAFRSLTGWSPRWSLEDGIAETWARKLRAAHASESDPASGALAKT
jgi:UDP-glucose 4-epimerase